MLEATSRVCVHTHTQYFAFAYMQRWVFLYVIFICTVPYVFFGVLPGMALASAPVMALVSRDKMNKLD